MRINPVSFTSRPFNQKDSGELKNELNNNNVILYDVDTTYGFMYPQKMREDGTRDGLYVPGSESIIPALERLKKITLGLIPKFETVDAHKPTDPELKHFSAFSDIHSEKGTEGSEKIPETVFGKPDTVIEVEPEKEDVPNVFKIREILDKKGIIRLEKNETTPLKWGNGETGEVEENKKAVSLFENFRKAGVKIALVFGVAEDYCVKDAVSALKQFGIKPIVIKDAIKELSDKCTDNPEDPVFSDVAVMSTKQLEKELQTLQ